MIYVHVPFCRSFCTYCDFYSEVACRDRDDSSFGKYASEICREAELRRSEIRATADVDTLYIGGGTPSVLPLDVLGTVVNAVKAAAGRDGFSEFTIEVNPEDIVEKGEEYVRGLIALGVNRVSMGVQSLSDSVLRWMNRRHDAARAEAAYRILRSAGVGNISVDLILGYDKAELERSLDGILSWGPDHISAYQLTIEEDSALAAMIRQGRFMEASDEECLAQYETICGRLDKAGFNHYEISNWARPGREAVHNSAYWTRAPYVGLGPGAHSFDGKGRRCWNTRTLSGWNSTEELLTEEDIRVETIMLALRTSGGVDPSILDSEVSGTMIADGDLARTEDGKLRIPEGKFFVSDDIISGLI